MKVTKRCPVCTRFRAYDEDDTFCVSCGSEGLEDRCECGRSYDYVLEDDTDTLEIMPIALA